MNRSALITRISAHFRQLTAKDIETSVSIILSAIANTIAERQRVELRDFGSFSVNIRGPPLGRNPRTGEAVAIPAKVAAHFKPGKEMRQRVLASAMSVKRKEEKRKRTRASAELSQLA